MAGEYKGKDYNTDDPHSVEEYAARGIELAREYDQKSQEETKEDARVLEGSIKDILAYASNLIEIAAVCGVREVCQSAVGYAIRLFLLGYHRGQADAVKLDKEVWK